MKITTWNMQGASHSTENKWNSGVLNLMNYSDVCCLQECGAVPASARMVTNNFAGIPNLFYYTWGTARTNKHILFYPADPAGNRCNLAVVSKTAPLNGALIYPATGPVWHPGLGFQASANFFICSLHSISPGGVDAAPILSQVNVWAGAGNGWCAGGDYNRNPNTLVTPFVVCPPNQNTYSVSNPVSSLDYCVVNFGGSVTGQVLGLIMSDHYPVGFQF